MPAFVLLLSPALVGAAPPVVDHQPALCTVPGKPVSLCAAISDDGTVAAERDGPSKSVPSRGHVGR